MGIFDKDKRAEIKSKLVNQLGEEGKEKAVSAMDKIKDGLKKERALLETIVKGEYPEVSAARLFNAALIVGADRKYSIVSIDRASYSVTFHTHKNEKYWDGKLSCFVIPLSNGSRISVSGSADRGVTTSGKGSLSPFTQLTQFASEGAQSGEEAKFKKAVAIQVPLTEEPSPDTKSSNSESNSGTDIPNQLKQLKELLDSGVLTQSEFEKAKAKLLS